MPYLPGPFYSVSAADVTPETDSYEFLPDTLDFVGKLQAIASGWDSFFLDLEGLATDELAELEGFDLDGLNANIELGFAWMAVPNLDAAMTAYAAGDESLSIAVAFAPPQAWQDPPTAYVAPGDNLLPTAPVIPPGGFDASSSGTVGSVGSEARPQIKLWNFTRVGSANFVVGDTFEIAALGTAGQTLSAGGTQNGQDIGRADFGVLDSNGNLGVQGVMPPEAIGAWHEDWYLDGVLVTSFNFVVTPAQVS